MRWDISKSLNIPIQFTYNGKADHMLYGILKQLLSKPNPNSNSMQLRLSLDIVLTYNQPYKLWLLHPQTFEPLLDKLGGWKLKGAGS